MAARQPTEIVTETVEIDSLTPDPQNARTHSERNISAIAGSLKQFGQVKPVIVASGNGGESVVIAGNGTVEAARSIGWTRIAIRRVPRSWSHEKARAYALADNRTAELADWDSDTLSNHLIELDANGWELADLGFDALNPPTSPEPPEDFPSYGDDTPTQHQCPKCGYEWSGASR